MRIADCGMAEEEETTRSVGGSRSHTEPAAADLRRGNERRKKVPAEGL